MRKNIAALTLPEPLYPAFVNITDEGAGHVSVTVRGPVRVENGIPFGPGPQVTINLTPEQWAVVKGAVAARP